MKTDYELKNPEELIELIQENIDYFSIEHLMIIEDLVFNEKSKRDDKWLREISNDLLDVSVGVRALKEGLDKK